MKADTDRGTWGAWARKERLGREWTVEEVVARVQQEAGVRMDVATLRGIEGGSKKPSVRLQDGLALVFGSRPRGTEPVPPQGSDVALAAVLEAVRVQTDELHRLWSVQAERAERQDADMRALVTGLTSLVQELRADREERTGRGEAAADYLGRIEAGVGELLQRSTPEGESVEPPARAGKVQ